MYHDVYHHDLTESGFCRDRDILYKMNSQNFEEQVRSISEYFRKNNISPDSIVFTFDDGGKSFYTIIAPILERYGFKGMFFISTNYIGCETFLTAAQIKELSLRGHIIGSHAHTHEHLNTLSDKQVFSEWDTSIRILKDIIGKDIEYASIPNGDITRNGMEIMNRLGFRHIYTSVPTTTIQQFKNSEIVGRYVVLGNADIDSVFKIITNKSARFLLLVKYRIIKVIKKILGSKYVQIKNAFLERRS